MLHWLAGVIGRDDSMRTPPLDLPSAVSIEELVAGRQDLSALPVLSLQKYRKAIEGIPCPTSRQIEDFACYVSGAKSWYKHLPLVPPGEIFTFYIDPWAGMDRILARNGRVMYITRTSDTLKFHYTWMTTEEYHSRFGWLAFASVAGTELFLPVSMRLENSSEISGAMANNPSRASIHLTEETEFQLPPEVRDAGTTRITGVVHQMSDRPRVWLRFLKNYPDSLPWPEETGGSETGRKIAARCRTIQMEATQSGKAEEHRDLDAIDEELALLLAPERRRLQQEMVLTMNRVVSLVFAKSV